MRNATAVGQLLFSNTTTAAIWLLRVSVLLRVYLYILKFMFSSLSIFALTTSVWSALVSLAFVNCILYINFALLSMSLMGLNDLYF
jgi:hypothetical protein